MTTILITGFGPFPGAPVNPTTPLVRHLARLRRPGLADVRLVGHVFTTSYAAVDRELPQLIARHRPDALLMFGVATRETRIRIETRARNALAMLPDATSTSLRRHAIMPGAPAARRIPAPVVQLLAGARSARVPAYLSRDAGKYLCNYISWRGAEAVAAANGPRLAAFIHVPPLARVPRRKGCRRRLNAGDLARAGEAILTALATAVRR
ncbi:MAG TPA: pyroglutamyl-peptidase I [Pseudolabrys sp.]|jgi:pyroglutamyl-peptidase|nr:pyroglutamyl-peptidase I [Pseudolabrys sp.]